MIRLLFILTVFAGSVSAQSFRFVDLDAILKKLPSYQKAQEEVNDQAKKWREQINRRENEIKSLREEFILEKDLMDEQLIEERQLFIGQKERDLLKYQNRMFGSEGEIIRLRKRLVKPVQDLIFSKIHVIAKREKIDVVFYKSKDNMVALYYSDEYDITSMVLNAILNK